MGRARRPLQCRPWVERSTMRRVATSTTAGSGGGDSLTGIEETIQGALPLEWHFFLDSPADVLSAAALQVSRLERALHWRGASMYIY
jgi:hypothetical protein